MLSLKHREIWFVTGSQHLYGPETLVQVAENAKQAAAGLVLDAALPLEIVCRPVVTTASAVTALCREADAEPACIGLIFWMHTFSPAKMWIAGLSSLTKPFLHLHTQFNREIPWSEIDMDFMNLNQAAHGDREFGFMCARLGLRRKVVVGHWKSARVHEKVNIWARTALALDDLRGARLARFGDNMRDVAVTEGDKVAAQITFGCEVHGYGLGDLAEHVAAAPEDGVDDLAAAYLEEYRADPGLRKTEKWSLVREAARIELGMRSFLDEGGFSAFTTTFEDLHGLSQLPGLACQRLMNDGFGFGAEGDWKTAFLVRAMKVMALGMEGGTSFMEDYTYHFCEDGPDLVLGAHMLEVCPSIAAERPALRIHPLGIGGKADPVRLVFAAGEGPALNASLIDLGDRFRLLANTVRVTASGRDLPRLPVAHALWEPMPDLETSAAAWIHGGGAHHTGFSRAATMDHLRDFAMMTGVELLEIDRSTELGAFLRELRAGEAYYGRTGKA